MIIKVFGWKVGLDRVNSISVRLVNDQRSRHLPNYLQFEGEDEVAQSCPTLCDPVDCSLPGFSIHGILQSRILERVAISFSRGWIGCYRPSNPGGEWAQRLWADSRSYPFEREFAELGSWPQIGTHLSVPATLNPRRHFSESTCGLLPPSKQGSCTRERSRALWSALDECWPQAPVLEVLQPEM